MKQDKTTDMTKGSILKHLIMFSIPLIIGNVFQQFYSMADTVIVGRTLGVNALAAVGSTGALTFFVLGFIIGLANGFSIMVSQRFGAGDMKGVRRSVAISGILCLIFSVSMMLLSVSLTRWMLTLMNTPTEIIEDAYNYIVVIFWGIPIAMFYNYISSIIRALGDSKTPLYFLLVASLLNIILDFVCILTFKMGVMGAGVATVFSQAVSGVLCLIYAKKRIPELFPKKEDWKPDGNFTWAHLCLGVPMAVQSSVIATGSMAVQTSLNAFGAIAMAGFTAAMRIEQLIVQVMVSIGLTLATFTGQNYGAGATKRIRDGVKIATIISLVFSIIGAIFVVVFGRAFTLFFIDGGQNIDEVVYYSRKYLITTSFFFPFISCIFVFRNALQGIGNTGIVLIGSAVELTCRLAGATFLTSIWGYIGLCLAGPFAWISASILFIVVYIVDMRRLEHKIANAE